MKVLLFTDADVFAGTEQHILDLAVGLRRVGIDACIGCPAPGALATRAPVCGVEVIAIAKNRSLDWRAISKLRRLCRENCIDVIHAHNGRTAFLAAVAIGLAGSGRCVYTQHFLEPSYVTRRGINAKVSRIIHRWIDRRTDHVIANSQATCRGILARGEAKLDAVTVIPNGIGSPDRSALRGADAVRQELGLARGIPLVVCAARLEPEKDVATLVDAMALIVREFPQAVCVVAGEGSLRKALEDRIIQHRLDRSMRLLGFRHDVLSIVNASDLFVLPSVAEPFGLVLIEAMSLGKPTVAVAAGGPLEIVEEGQTGFLVPPRDAKEMAAAIMRLLAEPETRQEMGSRGEARYRDKFTVERMAQETIQVYRRVLAHPTSDSKAELVSSAATH
jgi:glycosyltransferase involved in cell wall biosynthesis